MSSAIAPSWWSMGTLRVSLIGIHMMFVDSLHINRWLCGDKPTFCRRWCFWTHTHAQSSSVVSRLCRYFFPLIPMQSEGHLLIYLFQRMSDTAFQVFEQGAPDRIAPCIHPTLSGDNTAQPALFCCRRCRKVHNERLCICCLLYIPGFTWLQRLGFTESGHTSGLDASDKWVEFWEMLCVSEAHAITQTGILYPAPHCCFWICGSKENQTTDYICVFVRHLDSSICAAGLGS